MFACILAKISFPVYKHRPNHDKMEQPIACPEQMETTTSPHDSITSPENADTVPEETSMSLEEACTLLRETQSRLQESNTSLEIANQALEHTRITLQATRTSLEVYNVGQQHMNERYNWHVEALKLAQEKIEQLTAQGLQAYEAPFHYNTCGNPRCTTIYGDYTKHIENEKVHLKKNQDLTNLISLLRNENVKSYDICRTKMEDLVRMEEENAKEKIQYKIEYCMLAAKYKTLLEHVQDPFARDEQIVQLRNDAKKWEGAFIGKNESARKANLQAEQLINENEILKENLKSKQADIANLQRELQAFKEVIDTLKAATPEDLQSHTVEVCRNLICRNKINALKAERDEKERRIHDMHLDYLMVTNGASQALEDAKYWQKQHELALEGKCEELLEAANYKPVQEVEVVEVPKASKELKANLDQELRRRLDCLFIRTFNLDLEIEENKLYDAFLLDQPEHERLGMLHRMYKACHGGEPIPDKEAKNYDPNAPETGSGRIAKKSFAACLRAMGGVFKRKGTKILWRNIRTRREPCYANRFRASVP